MWTPEPLSASARIISRWGKETAKVAIQVINGKNPKDIPIKDFVPEQLAVNLKLAQLYGVTVPEGDSGSGCKGGEVIL